jgi:hypothetical protein
MDTKKMKTNRIPKQGHLEERSGEKSQEEEDLGKGN